MANFIHFLISVTLTFIFVSVVCVNTSPAARNELPLGSFPVTINHTDSINTTECDLGWKTPSNTNDTTQYCTYKQRSKKTAFCLSFFLGTFGADWFYLSRSSFAYIIVGLLKLLLGCGCCSAWPLTYFGSESQNTEAIKLKFRGVSTFITLLAFVWWIVDWARILGNKFADGNGEALMY
ncbi:unnamed protein product [Adineta steineri]|uniref:TM2 domain-containing protein n=1 Tax=Adineta steineri TaxID=433720 RepID=A0A814MIJ0_9BILA|nr:unnamed protein product [Adineta steineri]CAF1317400.1 unnamed protein product [Adineta steineri]